MPKAPSICIFALKLPSFLSTASVVAVTFDDCVQADSALDRAFFVTPLAITAPCASREPCASLRPANSVSLPLWDEKMPVEKSLEQWYALWGIPF